jgi:Tol biopolymer transport system component
VDGAAPVRLAAGQAVNPAWSPAGNLIVYAGVFMAGQVELRAMRPDGAPVELPQIGVRPGSYRFTPDGAALAYVPGLQATDFWLLDLTTRKRRQLTRLKNLGSVQTFDITPDGKQIVFDRLRENSNIVLIDLPK